jgi:hypothetical protein
MLFPGGTPVTVRVDRSANGFVVSDNGFCFRELEAIGAGRSFAKAAAAIAERLSVEKDRRRIFVEVSGDELSRAIIDVGSASWAVADKVYADRLAEESEDELEEELAEKLISFFGAESVKLAQELAGHSSTKWAVSAVVSAGDHSAVFQAVANAPVSIYRTSAAFHDLSLLKRPPGLVAVVRRASELGSRLGVLTQAARVIEGNQPKDIFEMAIR